MLKPSLWILVLLCLGAAIVWLSRTRAVPADVVAVVRGPIQSFVEEEGKTRVVDRYVVSAPVAGKLLRLEVAEGDPVERGQVIGQIDPLPVRALVEETRARMGALRERMQGVATKRPKPEEFSRAAIQVEQATEALAVAENDLQRAQVALEKAERDLERSRSLARQQRVPIAELDAVESEARLARERLEGEEVRLKIADLAIGGAKLQRAILEARMHDYDWEEKDYEQQIHALEAALEKLRDDLRNTDIRAPVDGTVLRRLRESEQVVQAGTAILEVGDLGALEVEADFLSEDAAHMRKDMQAEVYGRSLGDLVLPARIKKIYPSAFTKISSLGVEQQRVKVILGIDPEGTGLRDLYRVEVRIVLDARDDVVLVEEGALFRHAGAWAVFVVEEGRARLRSVVVGLRDGKRREVLGGLSERDVVLLHPDDTIQEGTRIQPLGSS